MIKYALAAAVGLAAFQPASAATIFDYNIYASGGASISGGSYGNIASGSFSNSDGNGASNFTSHTSSTGALDASAQTLSQELALLAPTGTFSYGGWSGDVTLTGTDSGINVFNIGNLGNPTWAQLNTLTIAGPGTGAIINVWGNSLTNWVNLNLGGLSPDQVIFNFHEASNIGVGGMNVGGTILAPSAHVAISGGSVSGSIVSHSFQSAGATIGGARYVTTFDTSPNAVPEPATWMMLILGFGAIGAVMRRRRKMPARHALQA